MLDIRNAIAECLDASHQLRRGPWPEAEVIHRFGVPGCETAAQIAAWERTQTSLGSKMTYNWVIRKSGLIEQALPLDVWGWHARGHSQGKQGVACVGDFRKEPPTDAQMDSLVNLCAAFAMRRGEIQIYGHDELPNSSSDPNKQCPGCRLDIGTLHQAVRARMKAYGDGSLKDAGVVYTAAELRYE